MHPLPKPDNAATKAQFKTITGPGLTETAVTPKGVVESTISRIKEGKKKFQESMSKAEKSRRATRSAGEIAQAKRYEDRRRKEIEQAKLDAVEERRYRKEERRKGRDV